MVALPSLRPSRVNNGCTIMCRQQVEPEGHVAAASQACGSDESQRIANSHADSEQQDEAEDDVAHLVHRTNYETSKPTAIAATAAPPAATVIGTLKRFQ